MLLLLNPPISSSSTFSSPCGRLVAVPAVVQLDARGREGERGGKKDGNETCVFSLMADFLAALLRLSVTKEQSKDSLLD